MPSYELIAGSGPTVVLMGTSLFDTLHGAVMGPIPAELIGAGFSVLSLDLPCHGADADPTLLPLGCWRKRVESGDHEIFSGYCRDLSVVLDKIGARNVSVVGLSRGGYVAAVCAASDTRIVNLALLLPLTDLQSLTEFSGYVVDESEYGLNIPALRDRRILVRIGPADDRVNTAAVLSFASAVNAEVQMLDAVGHVFQEDGSTVQWLNARYSR